MQNRKPIALLVPACVALAAFVALALFREAPGESPRPVPSPARTRVLAEPGPTAGLSPPLNDAVYRAARRSATTREPEPVATATSGSMRVHVQGPDGAPRVHAEVSLQAHGRRLERRETDEAGTARLSRPEVGNRAEVTVRAEGCATKIESLPEPVPDEVTIQLARGSTLAGDVRWAENSEPVSGALVLAWPAGYEPPLEDCQAHLGLALSPRVRVVSTDAAGNFRIDGLPESGNWSVSTVGAGALRTEVQRIELASTGPVALLANRVYAVAVRTKAFGGGRLETSPGLFGRGASFTIRGHDGRFTPPVAIVPEIAALGWPADLVNSNRARDEALLLATYADSQGAEVPVAYGTHVPGYRPAWTEVLAQPIDRTLVVHELELVPEAVGFGALEVRLGGPALGLLGELSPDRPLGEVRLTNTETGARHVLTLERGRGHTLHFDGIPFGSYRARFSLYEGGYIYPTNDVDPIGVNVTPESTGILELLVQDSGALRLLVSDPEGLDYSGRLAFRLVDVDSRATVWNDFLAAPYAIEGLPPGEYELEFNAVPGYDVDRLGAHFVFVGENQAHYEEIELVR